MKQNIVTLCLLAAAVLVGCEKQDPKPDPINPGEEEPNVSALILNEGVWGGNNASLTLLKDGTTVSDWFAAANGRSLGDLAQDLVIYGSKAYVTVSESGSLEVIDTATGISTRINLGNRYPRYIAADGGKLYVSCYRPRSVIRIDTATYELEATCELGGYNPEGLAVASGKLFVASSNISDEHGSYTYDNKVYVINTTTFSDPQTITVGSNPQKVMAVDAGRVIVNYWGNYGDQVAGSAVIDARTMEVEQTGQPLQNMTVADGNVYGYALFYDASWNTTAKYYKIDMNTLEATQILGSCGIDNPYAIACNPADGNIYVATNGNYEANGTLACFSADGTRRWSREMGMLPSKIVLL